MQQLKDKLHNISARMLTPLQQFYYGINNHIQVWKTAWAQQKKMPQIEMPAGGELEFLPAVLEVQESPPSPVGRAIIWSIVVLFTLAIIWAAVGKIDIVAVAHGKIIPSNHSKVIQPLEAGVISVIHIKEGQEVKKGDLLIELDSTVNSADQARFSNEQIAATLEVARLRALIEGKSEITVQEGTNPEQLEMQNALLQDQLTEYKARIESAQLIIEQRQAALEVTRENISHLNEAVPLLKERAQTIKQMVDKQYSSRMQYLGAQEAYLEKAQELATYKQRKIQDIAAIQEAKKGYQVIESEFNKNTRTELAMAQTRASSLTEEVVKAVSRTGYQKITAPINGVVQQLSVHTIGGVVTPAQQLMMLVPKEDTLEVEAWVQNKDIGFVYEGQVAEIKVDAFPFTKYGTIDGELLTLSNDAVQLEDIGYVFLARLSMDKSNIDVGNKIVNLSPGMSVSIEIKTGKRRLLEYFMNPILRGFRETARER